LARPETYDALIDYLEDERPLVRALANWHLTRLVPAGKEFKFIPTADKKDRDEAVKKWRKLIPPRKLPPKTDKGPGHYPRGGLPCPSRFSPRRPPCRAPG